MSSEPTFAPPVDEDARRRFEAAWHAGKPEPIERFLPPEDHPHFLATLEELAAIEMEFLWKTAPGREDETLPADPPPRVEAYLARFPSLNAPEIVRRLLREELALRRRCGERPFAEEYRARFPAIVAAGEELDATLTPDDAPPPSIRSLTLPGYEILGEIARGGMGVVYKARQIRLNRLAAVKVILGGSAAGPAAAARFRVEAEAVARLRHPHIVQIYEVGECDGLLYLALEYVEGGSLAQKAAGAAQPAIAAAELVETLARAVHFAHQQGVIHRDLKPANVLLAADGSPKVADFGLAKRLESDAGQTRTGEIVGTPSYMAPEQAAPGADPVGTPADVWALGAILYELLTGRPPFRGETAWDVLTQVASAEPAPPRRLAPQTPADLETICLKCLRNEPGRRYGSAEALADDLRRFLTDRPIQARRVGMMERGVKWVRRNAVLATLSAVVVLASAGGGGVWLWAARDRAERLSRAERTADVALHKAAEAEEEAAAVEGEADEKGREEPEPPETAKRVLELRRQVGEALDEAERARADALGPEEAKARTAERRRACEAELARAEKVAGLLDDLDKARGARATSTDELHLEAAARSYAAALSTYGLDVSRPEAETAAEIRKARPGVRLALVLALDDWAGCARDAAEAKRLGRIAGGADDDDWRRRCRAAAGDVNALKRLATEAPGRHLPAVSLIGLERELWDREAHSEAAALLRVARRQHPADYWVHYYLFWYLYNPSHPDPATLDEIEGAACAAVVLRPDVADAHNIFGLVLRDQGDLFGAAEHFRTAIQLDPKLAYTHSNLGLVLYDQGDLVGAAERHRKAIELDPKYANAHHNLGNVLYAQGDLAGAAACSRKAIELDPEFANAHSNLGLVLFDQGDLAGAADSSRKAIELDPKLACAHYNLGNVLYAQGDLAGAAESYHQAIELDPRDAAAHCNLGIVLKDQRDLAGAVEHYRKAVQLDPKLVLAHKNLGDILKDQGDLAGAAEHFRKVTELEPKNAAVHNTLGSILRDQGDQAGAAEHFRKVIELEPKHAPAHFNLGLVRLEQCQFAEAGEQFQLFLNLDERDEPRRAEATARVRRCALLVALEPKLGPVLRGEQQPADDAERLGLAELCKWQRRYAASARFYRGAFADDPKRADDLPSIDRYYAAGSAARAGCGQGEDAGDLDDKARVGWRKQALDWLRADLGLREKQLEGGKAGDRIVVAQKLRYWRKDAALAGLRDAAELAKLPADEREACRKFWSDVQSLLDKAGGGK